MYTYISTLANYADTKLLYVAEHLGDSHCPDAIDVKDDLTTCAVTKKGVTSHRDYL